MRVLVQRCKEARVEVDGAIVGQISSGYTLLVGITHEDTQEDARLVAAKIIGLRIFEDEGGKMNRSITEIAGAGILSVSQFTLYADCRNGRRPSFTNSAGAEHALAIYNAFNEALRLQQVEVQTGQFGAMMDVHLINWGPVTFWLDSAELRSAKKQNGALQA